MTITHTVQLQILIELLYKTEVNFSALNKNKLATSEFSYHINQLLKLSLVEKTKEGLYKLTVEGIHTASKLDLERIKPAQIPKSGIALYITRDVKNKKYILLGRKLRFPNKGKVILPGKKIVQGTSLMNTAQECLISFSSENLTLEYFGVIHFLSEKVESGFDRIIHVFGLSNQTLELNNTKDLELFWFELDKINELEERVSFLDSQLKILSSSLPIYGEIPLD
jgi:cell shape-determining protein MreC